MNAASSKSNPTTSKASGNATSSPVSADGHSQRVSPGGPTTENSGPALHRANRSPSSESKAASQTNVTYGPNTSGLSPHAGPLLSWENRLRQRLERIGSTECSLTWKTSATPGGRSYSQLAPSIRPIGEIESISSQMGAALWVTASARLEGHAGNGDHTRGRAVSNRPATATGFRSFWGDYEWVAGHDGKMRRVQPGLCPVGHGFPSRVGRLSAYGNAIVPQLAAEVIGAWMDCAP